MRVLGRDCGILGNKGADCGKRLARNLRQSGAICTIVETKRAPGGALLMEMAADQQL
jgi:hypothetical protein